MIRDESTDTIVEGLHRFQRFIMAHPRLLNVKEQLLTTINGAAPGSLILVLGPTGVGKTTLRLKTEQAVVEQMLPILESDTGRLPCVSVEAGAPLTGSFNWRDHFTRMLRGSGEPLLDVKGQHIGAERNAKGQFTPNSRAAGFELQQVVEHALHYRRPVAVFIDEAQHLGRIASGRKLSDQLDVVKSIANRTGTVHVLLGTYELLGFRNLSGQLSRRSVDVHFTRYAADDKDDLETFQNVLATFQAQLPLPSSCDLVDIWDFMYERSLGCVGILKEWLMRSLTAAIAEGKTSMAKAHIVQTALSVSQCAKIASETRDGEARLKEDDSSRSQLRTLLGLGMAETGQPSARRQCEELAVLRTKTGSRRRAPKRDPVGAKATACG